MMSERAIELFNVQSRVANLSGYKNVDIRWFVAERARPLFGDGGSLGIPYARVIHGYDPTDETRMYCEGAVEELFTYDEARAFIEYVRAHHDDESATSEPAKLPIESNIMGHGAIPTGGGPDFLKISDSLDYNLPFEVWGFFDLRHYEFDETLPGAQRARRGMRIHFDEEGRVEDIEPWFLDDPPKQQ